MTRYGMRLFAGATLALLITGFPSAPAQAQVRIPHPISCSLTLTGQQAWLERRFHKCFEVEVETTYRSQRLCFPYPGGQHCVTLYFFDLRARRVPSGGSVLVAKVDVSNSPQCSFVPTTVWSNWVQCGASSYSINPPARVTLSSTVLMY